MVKVVLRIKVENLKIAGFCTRLVLLTKIKKQLCRVAKIFEFFARNMTNGAFRMKAENSKIAENRAYCFFLSFFINSAAQGNFFDFLTRHMVKVVLRMKVENFKIAKNNYYFFNF